MKDEREYLEHILECIDAIEAYTVSGREALNDPKTEDAVIRRLQVMAESTLQLSDERKQPYPKVGWQHIRNFRNRLIHEYFEVNQNVIWQTIEESLPPLKAAVQAMLSQLPLD